jgi:hypothetical protein
MLFEVDIGCRQVIVRMVLVWWRWRCAKDLLVMDGQMDFMLVFC